MKGTQLPLAVALTDQPDFEHFHAGPNGAAVHTLRALLDTEDATTLLLHGPSGCGKSHLVQALLAEAKDSGIRSALVGIDTLDTLQRRHETLPLLCLDGLDATPLSEDQAVALIRLLDARKPRAVSTLITTRRSANQLQLPRPDLTTRLSSFASFGLKPLSDDDRIELLRLRASTRGLHLGQEVAAFMLKQLPRDMPTLLSAVDKLDAASLAAQRRLTIPFVQAALGLAS
jgi:DnaA-homolog protein